MALIHISVIILYSPYKLGLRNLRGSSVMQSMLKFNTNIGTPTYLLLLASLTLTGCFSDCPENNNPQSLTCQSSLKKVDQDAPAQPYPEFNRPVKQTDSVATLRRISDNENADKETNPELVHHYSKRQAWNADESIIDLRGRLIKMDTFDQALPYEPMGSERNWSNISPNIIFGIRFNPKPIEFVSFDLNTEKYRSINIFSAFEKCTMGQAEGSISADDRLVVLTCKKSENDPFEIISFDIEKQKIIAQMQAKPNLNWAGFSPSGEYILVENNTHPDPNAELLRYSPDLKNELKLSSFPEHGDFGYDTDGNEVYVMMEDKTLHYIRLKDRFKAKLPIGSKINYVGFGHISCRNTERPGWCYLSAAANKQVGAIQISASTPISEQLYPVDMKAKNAATLYEHWGFHNSSEIDYAAQPKATVSRSGRHILFTSNWNETSTTNEFIYSVESSDQFTVTADK